MDIVVLDFETTYGTKYTLQSLTYEEYIYDDRFEVLGVGIKINQDPTVYYDGDDILPALQELFVEENDHVLVAHNTLFDGAILSWHYGLAAGMYLCTQAMCRALWNQQGASLANLCVLCFPDDKTVRKGHEIVQFKDVWKLNDEQRAVMKGYCINDVDITAKCLYHMLSFFPGDELRLIDMTLRMFIHPPLIADLDRLERYRLSLEAERRLAIINSGLSKTTLASPAKFAKWILAQGIDFKKIPAPTEKNPDNMKWPLSKDSREFIEMRARHPEFEPQWKARLLVASPGELRRVERIIKHSRYMDGRVAVPLNIFAAHTFRYGGTNKVNFQNFKRGSEIRYSLLAPDGHQVVVQDLSNIESRMLAWVAQEPLLLDAYARGIDVYSTFASTLFGRPIDRKRKEIGPDGEEIYPDFLEGFVGKTCILGLGFQVAEEKLQGQLFSDGHVFSLPECKHFKDTYRGTYPRIPQLWQTAQRMIWHMFQKDIEPVEWGPMVVSHRRILMPNGLHLNYPGLRQVFEDHRLAGYEYWNGKFWTNLYGGKLTENVVQSLARILMTTAMLRIQEELRESMEGRVALTVHDEVIATVPDRYAELANERMNTLLKITPDWCNDGTLTLDAEGGFARNYSK